MDNLTHTLFAATLARTPLGLAGRGTFAALVVSSNAPDIDIIAGLTGGGPAYLAWHRGPTHGPLGVVGLGIASAVAVWSVRRAVDRARLTPLRSASTADASFGMLLLISTIAVLLHIVMDLPTSYGIRLLSPFDWRWFAVDWLPIVDIYLIVALAAGLAFGQKTAASRRRLAAIVLAVVAANYGVRAVAHRQALALAPQLFGRLLPPPCMPQPRSFVDSWPREAGSTSPSDQSCLLEIAAVPTFVSPFRWRLIAQLSNGYELHELDILDGRLRAAPGTDEIFWRRSLRYSNHWTASTFAAAKTHAARVFLGFARFPAARTFTDPAGVTTVRWSDMRFVAGLPRVDVPRPPNLLNVLVRVDRDGRVLEERMGR
jgi:membrane-bound metal-dependent hydrolase YbcI (DUF457 family)